LAARYALLGSDPGMPYLLFFPAVIASAVLLGRGGGVFAALLSAALAIWCFVPPVGSFRIPGAIDALGAALYIGITLLIAVWAEALHAAYAEAVAARAEAEAARARAEAGERERDLLLAERDHRVKNDMQRLVGLLAMQASDAGPEVAAALRDATERVRVVARLHDRLVPSGGDAAVDMEKFLGGLASDVRASFAGLRPIGLHVVAEPHPLPLDRAGAAGLVANELLTNALKHAFPGNRQGTIRIEFRREGADYLLTVMDDGKALPQGASPDLKGGKRRSGGLGQRLVRALAAQLGGRIEAHDHTHAGTTVVLRFPVVSTYRSKVEIRSSTEGTIVAPEGVLSGIKIPPPREVAPRAPHGN
jgi:two-component sensor histidine kinase